MIVKQIMTSKVVTVDMDVSLQRIRDLFEEYQFHHLLVTDQGKLVGVISDRDVFKALSPFLGTLSEQARDVELLKRRAHQIMKRRVIKASPQTHVLDACQIFMEKKISCLPVVNDADEVLGIVTWRDILRLLLEIKRPVAS